MAGEHVLHMQKALDQMNLQIHRVLNDITGISGLKILDAILAGERGPLTLARLCHGGVKSSEDTIAKSLEGIGDMQSLRIGNGSIGPHSRVRDAGF